ncbi:hypothetical protein ACFV1L_28900 [Kitasatospora sp. NPDC059646]|uniref:hypothetical protein n=1 Tax=Kitasatospora sp. NPDC059646 TaxID=3346893 RepID=UPI0036B022BC
MSTESTGAAEPGAAAAVPSEPPAAAPPAEPAAEPVTEAVTASEAAPTRPDAPPSDALPSDATPADTTPAEPGAEGGEPARKKRKFGAGALFLTAVVAGPLIGVGVGYGIQAARPATPLPALAAPKLSYPAERVDAKALAAAGPQPLNIDGDLRDLLIKRPDGTKDETDGDGDGWLTAADLAENYGNSAAEFSDLLSEGFRRAASVSWSSGDVRYRVKLMQYTPEFVNQAMVGLMPRTSDADLSKIAGNDDSLILVSKVQYTYARTTEKYYYGEALARKGTVLMGVQVYSKGPVDRGQLEDIAKRQWERIA